MCPTVVYLAHVISTDGIFPKPEKVRAVKEFRNPTKWFGNSWDLQDTTVDLCLILLKLLVPYTQSPNRRYLPLDPSVSTIIQ